MYTITDKALVDAAFESKRPRTVEEVWAKFAPECTVDANGRGHAPYDGFVIPDQEYRVYRAGEYLPEPEEIDSIRNDWASAFGSKAVPTGRDLEGRTHTWEGTHAMNRAAWDELKRQTQEWEKVRDAGSSYIGEIGKRMVFDIVLDKVIKLDGFYGISYINRGRDEAGNVIMYRGSIELGKVGDRVVFKASVKEHSEFRDVKQTVVVRPKLEK